MEPSFTARPLVGRWMALDFRPTRPLTLLGPAWAVICGAVAAGGLTWSAPGFLVLILSVLLCDALLGAWRALWIQSDWRTAFNRGSTGTPSWFSLADEVPDRFLMRLSSQFTRRLAHMRTTVWPLIDTEVLGMLIAGALALSVAVVLGQTPVLLTGAAMLLAVIEGQVAAEDAAGLRALGEIALPWLIAQSAYGYFSWQSVIFILLFTLVYRGLLGLAATRPERWIPWNNLTQLAVVLLLVAGNAPAGAGVVALGLLAQVLWQARYRADRDSRAYLQRVQSYILVAMLIAGLSLWL